MEKTIRAAFGLSFRLMKTFHDFLGRQSDIAAIVNLQAGEAASIGLYVYITVSEPLIKKAERSQDMNLFA